MSTPHALALVTGAARGIGAEVARQLGHAGCEVIVTARSIDAAQTHAEVLIDEGVTASARQLDIDDIHSVTRLAEELAERALDILVNNAAAFADWSETAGTADLARARSVMDTNLFGTWQVTQALLPALRRSPAARIVNVGSGSGSHGDPRYGLTTHPAAASYAVSKAALHAFSAKLAVELADEGIRVDVVDPGLTATAPGMEGMGARPVPEGAAGIVHAALDPADATTGSFTRDGEPLPW
jgi:NAD(P)-dependent dehydrogenase (short-subunit alcohol dehydrogenase family)